MKKFIFISIFSPMVLFGQDFSWGFSTNIGLKSVVSTEYLTPSVELGRDRSLNLATYFDYRVAGPLHIKAELFSQTARNLGEFNYYAATTYYLPDFDIYADFGSGCHYKIANKTGSFGFSTLLGLKFGQFDVFAGLAFNLMNRQKIEIKENLGITHYIYNSYPNAVQYYTDQQLADQNRLNAQAEAINYGLGSFFNTTAAVISIQYHLNNLNFGYRRSYGFHQLTLGYDIGRYRYE